MTTVNDKILHGHIRHMVWLERFKKGTAEKIISLLNKADDDLVAKISRLADFDERGDNLSSGAKKRLQDMLDAIREQRLDVYSLLDEKSRETLSEFALHEVDFGAGLIESSVKSLGGEVALNRPALSLTRAVATARPFQGRLLKEWFSDLGEKSGRQISDAIRIGIVQGETTDQIVRRIRGTKSGLFTDGILQVGRREVEAVVRTAVGHTANAAAEDLYEANKDIIKGVQWVSTLDLKTTPVCRARDGKTYPVKKGPRPPAHWGCRSRTIPYLGPTSIVGMRASSIGPVPENVNYQQWLKRQPMSVQEEVLGSARAKLFNEGGMTLDRFVDTSGKPFTLEQLKKKDGDIFDDIFGGRVKRGTEAEIKREDDFKEWMGEQKYNSALREAKRVSDPDHVRSTDISEAELVAINAYTGSYYRTLNKALRSGDAIGAARVEPFRAMLNAALEKMPVYQGLTKRGAALENAEKAGLKVGKTLKEPAFLSTSRGNGAFDGNVNYVIYSKNGRSVEKLSSHATEEEVLFKSGSKFKILDVSEDGDKLIVTMKEI